MNINDYFENISKPVCDLAYMPQADSLLSQIEYGFEGDEEDIAKFDVAIIGIADGKNSLGNEGSSGAVGVIRPFLSALRKTSRSLKIVDLGNVKGRTLDDRYFAVKEVVKVLFERQVVGVFVGGGQDYTFPVAKALSEVKKEIGIAVIDPKLDFNNDEKDFSSKTFLSQIKGHLKENIFELNVLGVQKYLVGDSHENEMKDSYWEMVRLRDLRNSHIKQSEPFLRDADLVSFDVGAIQDGYMPYHSKVNINGFTSYEACQLGWYAGLSDKIKFFCLGEYNPDLDENDKGAGLCAQLLWHLIEGISLKSTENPTFDSEEYKIFVVHLHNFNEDIRFYSNRVNKRWWIEVPWGDDVRLLACGEEEFEQTKKGELPEKWWRFFEKGSAK